MYFYLNSPYRLHSPNITFGESGKAIHQFCHNSYYLYKILNYKSFKYSKNVSNSCYLCGCKVACHIWCAYLLFFREKSCLIHQCTHVIVVIIFYSCYFSHFTITIHHSCYFMWLQNCVSHLVCLFAFL